MITNWANSNEIVCKGRIKLYISSFKWDSELATLLRNWLSYFSWVRGRGHIYFLLEKEYLKTRWNQQCNKCWQEFMKMRSFSFISDYRLISWKWNVAITNLFESIVLRKIQNRMGANTDFYKRGRTRCLGGVSILCWPGTPAMCCLS